MITILKLLYKIYDTAVRKYLTVEKMTRSTGCLSLRKYKSG